MILNLIELTEKSKILKTYNIYKACMYMPTEDYSGEKIIRYKCELTK